MCLNLVNQDVFLLGQVEVANCSANLGRIWAGSRMGLVEIPHQNKCRGILGEQLRIQLRWSEKFHTPPRRPNYSKRTLTSTLRCLVLFWLLLAATWIDTELWDLKSKIENLIWFDYDWVKAFGWPEESSGILCEFSVVTVVSEKLSHPISTVPLHWPHTLPIR